MNRIEQIKRERAQKAEVERFARVSVAAKERLAKLLATENLTIVHDASMDTAAFNVRDRVLYLPVWNDMDADLYDLFCGHETGHALYTPDGDFFDEMTPGQRAYLNVVEDARIENGQKKKFPGLRRPMRDGYSGLLDRNFFGDLSPEMIETLPLIDRINLKAKLGTAIDVPFTDDERATFDRVMSLRCSDDPARNAVLFEEAKALALELWEDARDDSQTDNHQNADGSGEAGDASSDSSAGGPGDSGDESDDSDNSGDSGDESGDESNETSGSGNENGESDDASSSEGDESGESNDAGASNDGDTSDSDSDGDASGDTDSDADGDGDSEGSASAAPSSDEGGGDLAGMDPTSLTYESFRENEKSLADVDPRGTGPKIHTVDVAADADLDPSERIVYAREHAAAARDRMIFGSGRYYIPATTIANNKAAIVASRKNLDTITRKGVGMLVREFEMKKAADASKRAMTSDTGVIDTNKLHTYKWNENIFAKNTIIPDGKSHGLVMFVDFSGSMQFNMPGTLEQIWSLMSFCDRVSIPFDIYSFTSVGLPFAEYRPEALDAAAKRFEKRTTSDNVARSTLGDYGDVTLFQLASSRDTKLVRNASRDMLAGLHAIYAAEVGRWDRGREFAPNSLHLPIWLQLGGTPLNETILASSRIVNEFRAETGSQIVNTIFLTDGAGSPTCYAVAGHEDTIVVRDPQTRREYILNRKRRGMGETAVLNQILRDRTGTNIVNFFVMGGDKRGAFATVLKVTDQDVLDHIQNSRHHLDTNETIRFARDKFDAYRKQGGVTITNSALGYDHQYIIKSDSNAEDTSMDELDAGASKAKIKKAFLKSRRNAGAARKVLSDFTSLIAA
jgi:hypothetical protein